MSTDPRSYRFQIRQVTRSDFSERPTYGGILWEESLLRVAGMESLEHRVRLAGDTAERIARQRKCEVAVCVQPLDGTPFIPEYFVHHCSGTCLGAQLALDAESECMTGQFDAPPERATRNPLGRSKFIYDGPGAR